MALTFGFYNSIEGDRKYDAIQFGRIFDGIITDGVYATYEKGMVVKASDNAGEVIIQPGRAWFNHTWNYNDADFVMEAPAPEVLLDRIDALVLDINEEQAVRENSFAWVTGTPSSNPVRPTLTNTTTHHQYPLCYVRRYAETTMIYTKDITSMVGTSECPFVTGVLEGMDIDAWINQWDDEFSTWENATKVSFEAWMLTQQTDYTAWFNAVRDQLGTDMTEFEAWFESIKGIIDEEAATHLQAEIDEIKTMLPSGSHITITTTDTELFSRNVLLRDDFGHEITSKFNTSGVAMFETVPYVGSLTISSTDGIRTATNVVNTPYFARYEFPLAFWSATVNIEGDEDLAGYTVTVYNSEETVVSSIVLNAEAKGVFNATYPDEFIFRITYGGETMEVSLDVREETTYTVTLSAGFNWRTWCTLGGVSTSGYSSLSDVFNDEKAVRRLMTVHASADYLIEQVTKKPTTIDDFVSNDTAMKWIGLRDYVCDGLTTITGVEAKFLASDYWERYLKDHVPVMTSATAPYGKVSAIGSYDTGYAEYLYGPFVPVEKTWVSDGHYGFRGTSYPNSNTYQFTNPMSVKKAYYVPRWYNAQTEAPRYAKLQYSLDGSNWVDASEEYHQTAAFTTRNVIWFDIFDSAKEVYAPYWRVYYRDRSVGGSTGICCVDEVQFYGRALDVSVPVMTSNTAPYGTFIYNGYNPSRNEGYKAFDKDTSTAAMVELSFGSMSEFYVGYNFGKDVNVKYLSYIPLKSGESSSLKSHTDTFQYSEDGSTWKTFATQAQTSATQKTLSVVNVTPKTCKAIRYYSNAGTMSNKYISMCELNIYGVDYSEREFASGSTMKYLYDHGLELETLDSNYTGGLTVNSPTKEDTQIYLSNNGNYLSLIGTANKVDLTNKSLIRSTDGDKGYNGSNPFGNIGAVSTKNISSPVSLLSINLMNGSRGGQALNISALEGTYYVALWSQDTTRKYSFKELWLE